ncbi:MULTISPECIES: FAD binding domain-containing protein [unclassified Brucella]|uniref:FAD binding domain-containing protein n=1 Tax=unclassified Brucella TaxID=2632610 RepID=UPI0012AD8EF8|nr:MULTISPECIES: FAD binding domain-containing protein [unclassified Brucella]MRN67551.1 carbon monoxide dehydrogenase [Brucella sp. 10RB9213]UWF60416.1 FAD binding domain-containing protein [Brucella sp. 2716]
MKPAHFDYLRPRDLSEALQALEQDQGNARVLAGGQSLLPMLNMRLARPALLVDIMGIESLRHMEDDGKSLRIGAAVRQAELERHPCLGERQPLLAAALKWVGHAQTRARGTVCGSVAHADPSAELLTSLIALEGTVHLVSYKSKKERIIPADRFVTGMMTTAKADNELIVAVSYPASKKGHGYAFREVGRRHGDFAIAACAAVANDSEAWLTVGGVADAPTRRALPLPNAPDFDEALNQFAWDLNARDDLHATARYRRDLVRTLGRETIEEAFSCRA